MKSGHYSSVVWPSLKMPWICFSLLVVPVTSGFLCLKERAALVEVLLVIRSGFSIIKNSNICLGQNPENS